MSVNYPFRRISDTGHRVESSGATDRGPGAYFHWYSAYGPPRSYLALYQHGRAIKAGNVDAAAEHNYAGSSAVWPCATLSLIHQDTLAGIWSL